MKRETRAGMLVLALLAASLGACECGSDEADQPPAPARPAVEPKRVAAQDQSLRIMVAELAAAKACEMIRGQFRGLRAPERPQTVAGIVWIRECRITNRGARVTFHLAGNGWQWVDVKKKVAGAKFVLQQYVRFGMEIAISGPLDVAYDTSSHVVSFLFTPQGAPEIRFTPVGDVEIDEKGAWSAVVGALGSVFGNSPDDKARSESKKRGAQEFGKSFADGLAVTIDLCTGLSRFGLERPPAGKMVTRDVGETPDVTVELQSGGVMIFGPYLAKKGMTVHVDPRAGAVRTELVCQEDGEALAEAFLAERAPAAAHSPLAARDVYGKADLRTRGVSCPVMVVARSISKAPAEFAWKRPDAQAARSAGGPVIACGGAREGAPEQQRAARGATPRNRGRGRR